MFTPLQIILYCWLHMLSEHNHQTIQPFKNRLDAVNLRAFVDISTINAYKSTYSGCDFYGFSIPLCTCRPICRLCCRPYWCRWRLLNDPYFAALWYKPGERRGHRLALCCYYQIGWHSCAPQKAQRGLAYYAHIGVRQRTCGTCYLMVAALKRARYCHGKQSD